MKCVGNSWKTIKIVRQRKKQADSEIKVSLRKKETQNISHFMCVTLLDGFQVLSDGRSRRLVKLTVEALMAMLLCVLHTSMHLIKCALCF